MSEEQINELIEYNLDYSIEEDLEETKKCLKEANKEIERLNMRLKTSNDTCNYLRNTIDKAIFFIQNQELHKSKDTTGAITMKERELIDILLGSESNE